MELLTIGSFAAACRLSAKALRLYDRLGLLPPARTDPVTGYRWYAPEQLERARLVAWLRRIGMPLARIVLVCDLPAPDAALQVAAFWAEVEAGTAARRDLAGFLVAHLSTGAGAPDTTRAPALRYAVRSDTGLVRTGNQDAGYADARLLAVADGFGAAGAPASAIAVAAVKELAGAGRFGPGGVLNALQDAITRADRAIAGLSGPDDPGLPAGTTLTAALWTGSALALVHIGDSRAYLLRDGELFQITADHTLVQSMVDDGRLSPAEAGSHPQRSLLLRALDGRNHGPADVRLHDALPGDRYLLCSDGLSTVLPTGQIRQLLIAVAEPQSVVDHLVDAVRQAGAPDNVTCVVADLA